MEELETVNSELKLIIFKLGKEEYATDILRVQEIKRMMGITSAASSWGRVAGPLLAGGNLMLVGYSGAWLGSAAIVLVYLLWACVQCTRQKPGEMREPAQTGA